MTALIFLLLFQSDPTAVFDQASTEIQNKNFVGAIELLRQLDAEGVENGPMLINLGIAYTQLDSLGLAKYYFTRAGDYPEVKTQSETGLTFITQQLQRRASGLPILALNRIQNNIIHTFNAFWSLLIPILLLNLGAVILVWHFRTPAAWRKVSASVLLIFAFFGFAHYVAVSAFVSRYDTGILIRQEATLHESPSSDSPTILPAFEGYEVRIDRTQSTDGWIRVILINGSTGWLPASAVKTYSFHSDK